MATGGVLKFKQKDKNRYRKVYPFLRRKPIYEVIVEGNGQIETGVLDFDNVTGPLTFPFTLTYNEVPTVTVTPVETSDPSSSGNRILWLTSISTTEVEIEADSNFIGSAHIHIISPS